MHRFLTNTSPVAEPPKKRKAEESGYGEEHLATLVDHFRPALETAGVEVSCVENEWTKLKDGMLTRYSHPSQTTWTDVCSKFQHLCPNVLALVDLVLSLPASSADAERGFNRLKITKSDWRSKLTSSHLSDLMMVMLESHPIPMFDPLPSVQVFMETPRRMREKTAVSDTEATPSVAAPVSISVSVSEADSEQYISDDDYVADDDEDEPEEDIILNKRVALAGKAYERLNELLSHGN